MESPPLPETPRIAQIGTNNIVDYLKGYEIDSSGNILRGDIDDFEKQFEIPEVMHQAIKEMYEQKREGPLISPNFEALRRRVAARMNERSSGLGDELLSEDHPTGLLEVGRAVYAGVKSDEIAATSMVFGYGNEVDLTSVVKEATKKGGLPFVTIHTHPNEGFFSPDDFSQLIFNIGNVDEPMRYIYAEMVLLPGMQLLAIATDDTPLLHPEDASSLTQAKMTDLESAQIEVLSNSLELLQNIGERKRIIETLREMRKVVGEEHADLFDKEKERLGIRENESEELDKVSAEVAEQVSNIESRKLTSIQFSFARELNLKLYFSRDMRTFKEFSA